MELTSEQAVQEAYANAVAPFRQPDGTIASASGYGYVWSTIPKARCIFAAAKSKGACRRGALWNSLRRPMERIM